jgi:hypothetical protein
MTNFSGKYSSVLIVESVVGHSAFGAGVTVPIVEASNVGVKVGMVGSGVIDGVGVSVGIDVLVFVGIRDGVTVDSLATPVAVTVPLCAQAVRIKIPPSKPIKICFNVFLPIIVRCFYFHYVID